jgi:subtilisin family serine protease
MTFGDSQKWRASRVLLTLLFAFLINLKAADGPAFHPGRILIISKAGKADDAAKFHKQKGRRVAKKFATIKNLEVIDLAAGEDVLATAKEYLDSGLVESAEPDYLLYKSVIPDDPSYVEGLLWHLNRPGVLDADINAPEGWEIRHEATNIVVAILDSGMRMTHEDLAPNLWTNPKEIPGNGIDDDGDGYVDDVHGLNSITGTGDPTDDDGHGTHVAGILGAAGDNGKGITGVAWRVQLMPLKFINSFGEGFTSDGVECMNYAIAHGAQVINASFGSPNFSTAMQVAIFAARDAGIVFVAAAGNESVNNDLQPSYPANYGLDNVISVAATSQLDALEDYSNFGASSVDIAAPGTLIYSCGHTNDAQYVYMSGTSMATPIVSGVVALIRAQWPNETPSQIRQRLIATADPLPSLAGKCVSGGKVNLQRALSPFVSAVFSQSIAAGTAPLTVAFTNKSIGQIGGYSWNFGDGSPISNETNPTHVFNGDGNFTVTLTVTATNGVISSATRQVSAEPTYSFKTASFEWIDPTNMTRFSLADNGVSGAQDLPFAFNFYGAARTQIYIGANGLLGFDPSNMGTTTHSDIPSATAPNGLILPYWDNLNPASSGGVYAGVVGQAPNRRYVVSWVGVTRNTSADKMTFQAALGEDGAIQFNYLEVNPASARGGGLRASIGIEDFTGLVGTKYCVDGAPNTVTNSQSIVFNPIGGAAVIQFSAPTYNKGVFQVEVPGAIGRTFVLEASANLVDWQEAARGVIDATGLVRFTDGGAGSGNRFFRAQVQ